MILVLRIALALVLLALAGGGAAWWLTAPGAAAVALPDRAPDPANGERVFWAGGCASCHAAPDAEGEAKLILSGGQRLESDFGSFAVPNISPHPQAGIGAWTAAEFAAAMTRGVSPGGRHYYPAFPYTAYARMRPEDVQDLFAYLGTLPESDRANDPHALAFPFDLRRGVGLWKRLFLSPDWVLPAADPQVERGRYLVEALGHCGECHTPRNALGGLRTGAWLSGGPNPEGKGSIPNITPHADGLAEWGASDIAYYLESGFTPSFDTAGGAMVAVVENTARLTGEDRAAIAAYLKAAPPLPDGG